MRKMWAQWYLLTCQGRNPPVLPCVWEMCRSVQKTACGKSGGNAPPFSEEVLGNSQRERAEEEKFERYRERTQNLQETSLVAQLVKNLPATRETWVRPLNWEDPLEEGLATHSSIPAWRVPMDRGAWRTIVHGAARSWT